jgi:hypothetical protein
MKAMFLLFALMLAACSEKQINTQRAEQAKSSPAQESKNVAELKPGEASGTIMGGGETVQVRYAYAHWVKDAFNADEKMIELLLSEREIPKEQLAFIFADNRVRPTYEWLGGELRGMKFRLKKDGYTYGFGPIHLAISEGGGDGLDEFKLEGDRVSGADQESGLGFENDRWSYSISFVASLGK